MSRVRSRSVALSTLIPGTRGGRLVALALTFGSVLPFSGWAQVLNVAVQPPAQVILPGSSALFTASATGSGPFGYQWRLNGTTLQGQTNASLALINAQSTDAGSYSVVVTNIATTAVTSSPPATLAVVNITDPQLKAVLSASLSSSNQNLLALTNLWARNYEITNLSGIAGATNLVLLDLAGNSISDLTPLQGLTNLQYLNLDANAIASISPLTNLANLTSLSLARNYLLDYSPLSNLTNLTSLSLHDGALTNLNFLTNLFGLKELIVYHNGFTDLSPLTGLINLTSLDLRWNNLTNPGVLSSLTNSSRLSQLFLAGTGLSNIDFVKHLTQLTSLNLGENSITDLSPLLALTDLEYLTLSWNNSLTNDTYTNLSIMTGLASLELRGNGLTNVGFLSGLRHLAYADLAFNNLSDLSPLARITNLSLVLDANTNLDYGKLSLMTNIARIWLNGCSITNKNVAILSTMRQLKALSLEQNSITDPTPLAGLTNLTLLGLSQCPLTNYDWVTNLPSLESLRLDGNSLSNNPSYLSTLSSLSFLSLNNNRFTDLSALTAEANLTSLYLTYNWVCDAGISVLTNLSKLRFLDVSYNLDSVGQAKTNANLMRGRWVSSAPASLSYLPMDQLNLSLLSRMPPTWHIPSGRTRRFDVYVSDLVVPIDEVSVTSFSLPSDAPLTLTNFVSPTGAFRTVSVTAPEQIGTVTDVLLASNSPCGLTTNISIVTQVEDEDTNFFLLLRSLELSNALWQALSAPADGLTSVDLMNLTSFSAVNRGLTNLNGLQWATNLNVLNLSSNGIHLFTALSNLTHLTSLDLSFNPLNNTPGNTAALGSLTGLRFLSLSGTSNTDITSLTNLTNLQSLDLSSSLVTDFTPLAGLTSLTTLNLADDVITNLSFLTNLTSLVSLNISSDKLVDISRLNALTNLSSLYLQQNRLTNIAVLANLPHLSNLDIQFNLLGPNTNSTVAALQNRGAYVLYLPQRGPPLLDVRTNWVVASGTNSSLSFSLSDTGPDNETLSLSAISSNLNCTANYTGHDNTWSLSVTNPPIGKNVITLSATNDVDLGTNVAITVEVITNLNSDFSPLSSTNSPLSNTNLAWTTSGDKPWLMQNIVTFGGKPAAESGGIGNSQNSDLQLTNLVGPGRLTFWWRVSSESNFDWFEFDLGSVTNRISGESGWQQKVLPVPPGLQTAQWRYYKDANTSVGLDAGFLAQVTFEPGIWLEMTRRPTNVVLNLHGVPGLLYEVQVSTNFSNSPGTTNWFPLAPPIVATNISVRYTDSNVNSKVRLYRLHSLGEPNVWLELTNRPSNGQCVLVLHTYPGLPYQILAATNLSGPAGVASWFSLSPSIVPTTNIVTFTDTNANSSVRFYRLRSTIQF
jgi:internalin A